MKTSFLAIAAAAALSVATLLPAQAQQQEGLVNVMVGDVLVQVPIGVAAQVCPGVSAAVIVDEFKGTNEPVCTLTAEQAAEAGIGGGPGKGKGQGQQD